MSPPELVVPVADLDRGPKHVDFTLSEAWLRRALQDTDASVSQPGSLTVDISKNGQEVLVRGNLNVQLTLPCVVTLDPVAVNVDAPVLLMLAPQAGAPSELPSRSSGRRRAQTRPGKEPPDPAKPERVARPERSKSVGKGEGHWDDTPVLTEEDAGRDTFDGHEVVLDAFIREFLILELPMFPRRSDLPTEQTPANPPLPAASPEGDSSPIDPRLSPLAELKSRLEKINKE
jgi:uncharacterized metal-binding protein YceD (DUF177 family)